MVVRAHQRKGSETSQSAGTELSLADSNSLHSSEGILSPGLTSTTPDSAVESFGPSPTPHCLLQGLYLLIGPYYRYVAHSRKKGQIQKFAKGCLFPYFIQFSNYDALVWTRPNILCHYEIEVFFEYPYILF